jgi:hypothetical protein
MEKFQSRTYLKWIRPAMMDLAREVEPRAYRREPCFRMHFVASVSRALQLRAGEREKPLRPEEMTVARYSWSGGDSRRGNLDFVLRDTPIECNYTYACAVKIEQDFIKLLDEENGFDQSVYWGSQRRRTPTEEGRPAQSRCEHPPYQDPSHEIAPVGKVGGALAHVACPPV